MKLELKHLAPYLPYGFLYGIYENQKVIIRGMNYNSDYLNIDFEINNHNKVSGTCFFNEIKPILRPLSDITKEIEVNGVKFAPFKWFNFINSDINFETQIIALSNDIRWLDSTYYGIIEKLLEWHFDIYGLIENGLATDINSLPQSSE